MQCETIKVKAKDGSCMTINKSDYSEKTHILWSEDKPAKPVVKRRK
jgi:hypothetical protein